MCPPVTCQAMPHFQTQEAQIWGPGRPANLHQALAPGLWSCLNTAPSLAAHCPPPTSFCGVRGVVRTLGSDQERFACIHLREYVCMQASVCVVCVCMHMFTVSACVSL